jgi:UDP-galactopyranose mutase
MLNKQKVAEILSLTSMAEGATGHPDMICLSHLRWDFVYQRPQHLLSRFAKKQRLFFIEEPIFDDGPTRLDVSLRDCGVTVVVPRLPKELEGTGEVEALQRDLLDTLFVE